MKPILSHQELNIKYRNYSKKSFYQRYTVSKEKFVLDLLNSLNRCFMKRKSVVSPDKKKIESSMERNWRSYRGNDVRYTHLSRVNFLVFPFLSSNASARQRCTRNDVARVIRLIRKPVFVWLFNRRIQFSTFTAVREPFGYDLVTGCWETNEEDTVLSSSDGHENISENLSRFVSVSLLLFWITLDSSLKEMNGTEYDRWIN